MKSFLIIGMGNFGHYLCENLLKLGNDVMVVDDSEERVADMIGRVENILIGDCTDPQVIKSLGVANFDIVFVCIGENFRSSLEITWLVKQAGAKHVVSKANEDMHSDFLKRNGADEIIYPDREIAEKKARAYSADSIFDYWELEKGYSAYEIRMPKEWIGNSLRELNLRQKYKINVIGLKQGEHLDILPAVDYKFKKEDRLLVVGAEKDVEKLLNVQGIDDNGVQQSWKIGRKQV